jgi:hypothetical protein
MEIGSLTRTDFQVWVPFEDAEVLIRYLPLEELQDIVRKATRTTWDRSQRKVETLDPAEANRLLGRASVRGWMGITMNGEEFPYSAENSDFLMARWLGFSRFVNEACLDLQGLVAEERRQREKKSTLTSGQGGTSRA